MSFLDGVIGGLVSAGAATLMEKFLDQQGGLQGLIGKFDKGGLGAIASSWVGKGENMPVNASQVTDAFGEDKLAELAEKFGLDKDTIAEKLAELLPNAVDKMTPEGTLAQAA